MQGRSTYSHRVVVEVSEGPKEVLEVKCVRTPAQPPRANLSDHAIFKRNVLPAGFQEPE